MLSNTEERGRKWRREYGGVFKALDWMVQRQVKWNLSNICEIEDSI